MFLPFSSQPHNPITSSVRVAESPSIKLSAEELYPRVPSGTCTFRKKTDRNVCLGESPNMIRGTGYHGLRALLPLAWYVAQVFPCAKWVLILKHPRVQGCAGAELGQEMRWLERVSPTSGNAVVLGLGKCVGGLLENKCTH